ncbi:uncharacterized protein LOC116018816 [Ipomoea triloba]|uniref:uncharacterized protein LOC116018816 n=1 Tax=Ipomoea triloba TaxID=35885 RepID=UPI00125E813E|nr:uncharacterized protein LOC116018816 [Ipomoea triloba]GLL39993.1 uncharacterized protein LOC109171148 [Ipomoea trifida]GMD50506.1 WD repeat containing protein [Ipomoea batatas]GMD52577.1 WD repeat containing protein [Ipomoea batatas]GMD54332.1 WD repeat containing protein [Ipomoea batatas]GMD55799.1 WD repeat containing protein [Ipomoea batatas]
MAGESQKMEAPPLYTEMRRSKFVWRSVLIFNLALGAYIFSRPVKKDSRGKEITATSKDMTVPPETSAPAETTTLDFDEVIFFPTEPEKVPDCDAFPGQGYSRRTKAQQGEL